MTNKSMPKVGDVVAGKYAIERIIGEGGMGAVFAASHKLTGKHVALKWMLPELARDEDAVQRFMREAQAAGRINHPNVVDVYDVGQHEDSFFLVMELLSGEPLTTAIERHDLSSAQVIDLMLPALRGLAAAHKQGVVHRDLKPDNIFLCRDDDGGRVVPKVLDFGISKVSTTEGQVNPRLTKTGAVVGTPYYMSPEQIRGSDLVDQRSDIYAMGVILYEALTGKVPFSADTYSALILEIATGTPKDPCALKPDLSPELAAIVMKAMAREAGDRYADVEGLAQALEPFSEHVTFRTERRDPTGSQRTEAAKKSLSTVTTPFASEAPVVPRSRGGGVVVGVAAVVLLGAAAFWWSQRRAADVAQSTHVVTPAAASAPPAAPEPPAATAREPEGLPVAPAAVQPVPAAPAKDVAAAAPAATGSSGRERARGSQRRARNEPTAAAAPAASQDRPKARARSGTISVDDF